MVRSGCSRTAAEAAAKEAKKSETKKDDNAKDKRRAPNGQAADGVDHVVHRPQTNDPDLGGEQRAVVGLLEAVRQDQPLGGGLLRLLGSSLRAVPQYALLGAALGYAAAHAAPALYLRQRKRAARLLQTPPRSNKVNM